MQRELGASNNDRAFIAKALRDGLRIDGRRAFEHRKITYRFAPDDSSATVTMGETRVMSVVTATLAAPVSDRQSEGSVRFNVEMSPLASPAFEGGRPGPAAVEAATLLERVFRDSRAIDQEALCVLTGQKVWHLRVDTHVLDAGGNLSDAAVLGTLAALLAFRRPDIALSAGPCGEQRATAVPTDEREPVPLSLHHLPVAVTFALLESEQCVADPCRAEEAVSEGCLTIVATSAGDVVRLHKAGTGGVSLDQVAHMLETAQARVGDIVAGLREALAGHEKARLAARVRRAAPIPPPSSRSLARSAAVLAAPAVAGCPSAVVGRQGSDGPEPVPSTSSDDSSLETNSGAGVGTAGPAMPPPPAGRRRAPRPSVKMQLAAEAAGSSAMSGLPAPPWRVRSQPLAPALDDYRALAAAIAGLHSGEDKEPASLEAAVKPRRRGGRVNDRRPPR